MDESEDHFFVVFIYSFLTLWVYTQWQFFTLKTHRRHYRWRQAIDGSIALVTHTEKEREHIRTYLWKICICIINKDGRILCMYIISVIVKKKGMMCSEYPDGYFLLVLLDFLARRIWRIGKKIEKKKTHPHRAGRGWWISFSLSILSLPSGEKTAGLALL